MKLLTILTLLATLATQGLAGAEPLLRNGDFETPGASAQALPAGWSIWGSGGLRENFSRDQASPHGGSWCLRFTRTPDPNEWKGGVLVNTPGQNSFRPVKGKAYTLTFWARAATAGQAKVEVKSYRSLAAFKDGPVIASFAYPVTADWQAYTLTFKEGNKYDAGEIEWVYLAFFPTTEPNTAATLWLDDVAVTEIDASADTSLRDTKYAAYAATFRAKELGSFRRATPLIDGSDMGLYLGQASALARFSVVPATGCPHMDKAYRIAVTSRPAKPFDVQFNTARNTSEIRKGDVIFYAATMRVVETRNETGEGRLVAWPRANEDGYAYSLKIIAGKEWETTYGHMVATRDYPTNTFRLLIHASSYQQTVDLGSLLVLNLGPGVDEAKIPRNTYTYAGREPDAPWRAAARERIAQHRQGSFTLQFDTPAGQMAPSQVSVRLLRHGFRFGGYLEFPALGQGNEGRMAWSQSDSDLYRHYFTNLFSGATAGFFWGPGDDGKGGGWGWESPRMRQQYLDLAAWAHSQGLPISCHVAVYEGKPYNPKRIIELKNDPPSMRRQINEHILEKVGAVRRFAPYEWQVINEHLVDSYFSDCLGGRKEILSWFKLVRQADPQARLIINDAVPWDQPPLLDRYEALARELQQGGAELQGIGFQSHIGAKPVGIPTLLASLDRFTALGVRLSITEFDVEGQDEALQADYTRDFYTAVFSHPAVDALTTWGFWEGRHWKPSCAMLRKDWTPKPSYHAYTNLLHGAWHTAVSGALDAQGTFSFRGYFGEYEVCFTQLGRTERRRVTLTESARQAKVTLP
ncbi:MAG: endo-1,4-beta-xylanase [Spirochaetes bacterium]|nr:endo-1,4-beta-xylanase [Spirochaetota bacterium]